ncbi:unnamed protein product [Fraxinus pennsylvanica]|uniref:Uncharacterized protein n=1 Tax=Fraxinus pennsylvanica TaxID=56036 RepID=A0AAD1ZSM1_9LAMI|nr:unnamed protein product [Fraxinus pennsylvanica]
MIAGKRSIPIHQRRRLSLGGVSNSKDSAEDFFSDESDVSEKLGRLSIESAKQGRSGLDDLLLSTDGGKHDYDCSPPMVGTIASYQYQTCSFYVNRRPSASGGRTLARQNLASVSRPSSPGPRVRPQPQPIVPPDFPLETPPNLRTTLPDRPPSAGRSRPGAALTLKGNTETTSSTTFPRRQPSPMVVRGRITESIGRGRMHANGQLSDHTIDSRRELSARKPVNISTESTGFGRNISKKSLDVAIRNMDIKNGANSARPLTGSNLYPQSIRSTNRKSQSSHSTSAAVSVNGTLPFGKHGATAENRNSINRSTVSGNEDDKSSAKLSNADIYESSRYDILLKEDLKNTNWLHSVEDKSDQEPIFDNGLEPLPEPFSPL